MSICCIGLCWQLQDNWVVRVSAVEKFVKTGRAGPHNVALPALVMTALLLEPRVLLLDQDDAVF